MRSAGLVSSPAAGAESRHGPDQVFTIPMQWYGMHSDPFPKGYPSYMVNGLCAYGPNADQCPEPGVMMPRPLNNPF